MLRIGCGTVAGIGQLIIDTDVLVWDLRGSEKASSFIAGNVPFSISVVTYMELVQGMRDRAELRSLLRQLRKWSVSTIQITPDISMRAMFYVEEFFLSHSMYLADALIGATAVDNNETLLTANDKHYRHIEGIQLQLFSP